MQCVSVFSSSLTQFYTAHASSELGRPSHWMHKILSWSSISPRYNVLEIMALVQRMTRLYQGSFDYRFYENLVVMLINNV